MNIYDEYKLLIKEINNSKKYYIILNDNQIEVNKNIFIQIFGLHKTKCSNGTLTYHIVVKDIYDKKVSKREYYNFNSFISQNIKNKNIFDRYIEHSIQSEETIQKHMIQKTERVEDIVYRNLIIEEIEHALMSLNEIQRRRFVMYYIDEMTYEQIAKIEGCTKRAIKFSVDAARKNLQKMLKNLYLDYTNQ